MAPLPIPIKMGVPSLGGPIAPAGGQSTPMTYAIDGRQYVVTAAGGHGSFGTKQGDYAIAYRLP